MTNLSYSMASLSLVPFGTGSETRRQRKRDGFRPADANTSSGVRYRRSFAALQDHQGSSTNCRRRRSGVVPSQAARRCRLRRRRH